jgi:hypothetical protein
MLSGCTGRRARLRLLRGFTGTRYAAKSWDWDAAKSWDCDKERRVVARIEGCASHENDMLRRAIDIRYVVTSLLGADAEYVRRSTASVNRPRTSSMSTRPWQMTAL